MTKISGVDMAAKVFANNLAFAQSGTVIEMTGNNDGAFLDRLERVWGLKNDSYCAMGQYYNFAKVYCEVNNIQFTEENAPQVFASMKNRISAEWLYFDPLVANMKLGNEHTGMWRSFDTPNDITRLVHGDYILYIFATGHHIEQFDKYENGKMWVVGWNTTPQNAVGGNSSDPGKGGGCYYKWRSVMSGDIWGWIPWTYGK